MLKNWSLRETEQIYDQEFTCSDNPGQNIWNKIEKSSKIGQDKKSLSSTFACFWTTITYYWALGYISTHICDFSSIS